MEKKLALTILYPRDKAKWRKCSTKKSVACVYVFKKASCFSGNEITRNVLNL